MSHIDAYHRAMSEIDDALVSIREDDNNLNRGVKKSARRIRKQLQVIAKACKIGRIEALAHVKGDD